MTFKKMAVASIHLLLAAAVNPLNARAQESALPEYQVKAAYLFNFAKFIDWPDGTFAAPDSPLVIGVVGEGQFLNDLQTTIQNKKINEHPVRVRVIKSVSDLKDCQILFLTDSESHRWDEFHAALGHAPVLTVAENFDRFTQSGGMIDFFNEDKKIRFEINNAAANEAGLRISSKLLMIGRKKPVR
jgi:hypothetical protein